MAVILSQLLHIQEHDGSSGEQKEGTEQANEEEDEDEDEGEELDPPKVLGDILESVAGAIFLDSKMDLEAVWEVFKHLFELKIRKLIS